MLEDSSACVSFGSGDTSARRLHAAFADQGSLNGSELSAAMNSATRSTNSCSCSLRAPPARRRALLQELRAAVPRRVQARGGFEVHEECVRLESTSVLGHVSCSI